MRFSSILRNILLNFHAQHHRIYSFYKIREIGLTTSLPLTAIERDFYLELNTVLKANHLIVYDIGAAKGVVSSLLAKLPNVSEVHAFEPIPNMYSKLLNSMKPYPKVHCHNVALSDQTKNQEMYIASNSDSSSLLQMGNLHKQEFSGIDIAQQILVNCVRLDDYVRDYQLPLPNVVKIDVQGYENKVLQGGEKTIKHADYCFLEMNFEPLYIGSAIFDDTYQLMKEMGFSLIGVTKPTIGASGSALQVDGLFKNLKLL